MPQEAFVSCIQPWDNLWCRWHTGRPQSGPTGATPLLLFLEKPAVPADNNLAERDIRSVAAARADGGVNRSDRGAKVFANMKTVIRTCHKQGLNFFDYARQVMRSTLTGLPPPLPLATADA